MTTNNEKMSAEEMTLAMMLKAGFVNPDTLNPFVVGFSTHPYPALREWSGGCECSAGYKCDECKYDDWMTKLQEEDSKAFSQHLQERENERRGLQVVPAYSGVVPSQKPREMFNLQAFMANNPSREEVLETCCAFANGNCLEITDSYIWAIFETLLDLRVEEFFNDTYSLGYLSAEVFGQRNWKVVKGNGKLFTLSSKFDEFVHLAGDLGISAKQLEQLLPARK